MFNKVSLLKKTLPFKLNGREERLPVKSTVGTSTFQWLESAEPCELTLPDNTAGMAGT